MRREDIARAIRCAGNSSPGPDGIPYAVWRTLKELGVSILFGVAVALERHDAQELLKAAYSDEGNDQSHDFNLSTMVSLPKAASGEFLSWALTSSQAKPDLYPSSIAITV